MSNSIEFINIWKEEGNQKTIKAVKFDNNCPAYDFLGTLTEKERRKVDALFCLFFQKREIINIQKVRKLSFTCKACFEFKPDRQIRISFVYLKQPRNSICLLDGFKKKTDKWPKNKRQKTENLCQVIKQYEKTNI